MAYENYYTDKKNTPISNDIISDVHTGNRQIPGQG